MKMQHRDMSSRPSVCFAR